MKTMLKIFSVLTALAMIFSLAPLTALAETPVTAAIRASVAIEGTAPVPAETYTIRLTADGKDFPMPNQQTGGTADLKITGAGSGTFPAITFDRTGVYTYTVKQIAGKASAAYDSTVYDLKITVYWENEALAISVALRKNGSEKKLDTCSFKVKYPTKISPTPTPKPTPKPGGGGGTPFTPDKDLNGGMIINVGDCLE